ncbi:CPBP family intramembrane glutamic endopeptidase [Microbacterium sp. MYb62]|uniref:CPBP family intramembrane glutamic endopeptidase n=1 Tax=Microbacterium sp. MYb62 TaxID=1848690 RepID=UPI000CFE193B|nr:CPBP family intramembrane glutamic endopeptidase [Microbacterium sp. MYb62]PRB16097.1 CPBP family intramembrane metalloprotease [Microbacterium sp. MYb62]
MSTPAAMSPWKTFWEKGGWWRALVLAAVYFVLYDLLSLAFTPLALQLDDPTGAAAVVVYYVLPLIVGGLLLVAFITSVGWWREIFGPQPIRGGGWMWIAIVVVLLFNILRFATIDYGDVGFDVVATWLLAGLLIGFAEEVLTRGLVVNLARKAGYREIVVAVISAGVFAGLHAGNLLNGQSLFATAFQLVYTFAFGILMYLALRVTGTIIAPILLHASTDPSIFLQTAHPAEGALTGVAGFGNIVVIVTGFVLIFFIRGRVGDAKPSFAEERAA